MPLVLAVTHPLTLTAAGQACAADECGTAVVVRANRFHPLYTRMVCTLGLMGADFRTTAPHDAVLVWETMRRTAAARVSRRAHVVFASNRQPWCHLDCACTRRLEKHNLEVDRAP